MHQAGGTPSSRLPKLPPPKPPDTWIRTNSSGDSVIEYRVGGRVYPQRSVGHCKTCRSPYRSYIEDAMLKGHSYQSIVDHLPESAKLTARNIGDHYRARHMPIDEQLRRAIIEQRAAEMVLDVEDHEAALGDHVTFVRLGVQEAIRKFAEGEFEMTMDHALQFVAAAMRLETLGGLGMDQDTAYLNFVKLFAVIREVCSPEQVLQITAQMQISQGPLSQRLTIEARTPTPA